MLTTLLRPTSGRATVAGVDVSADPAGVRARIGNIGQGNDGGLLAASVTAGVGLVVGVRAINRNIS